MSAPASANQRVRARQPAREASRSRPLSTQAAAPSISSTSSASGLLKRNMRAVTGVVQNSAPATMPAALPQYRRAKAWHRYVHATPMTAWGSRMAKLERPSTRTDSAMSQIDAGGLSTVMAPPASEAPHRKALQLCEPACAAAL